MFPCHQRMPNVSHFGFNESTLYTESVHFLQQHKIFYGLDTIVHSTVSTMYIVDENPQMYIFSSVLWVSEKLDTSTLALLFLYFSVETNMYKF